MKTGLTKEENLSLKSSSHSSIAKLTSVAFPPSGQFVCDLENVGNYWKVT